MSPEPGPTSAAAATSRPWGLGPVLVLAGAVVLLATGIAYVLVPGASLGIVGIASTPTSDFLLRTEGVALLFGGAMLLVARGRADPGALAALAGYLIVSSVVDAVAFAQGIVGPASVPSVVVRVGAGVLCLGVAVRSRRSAPR